MTGNRLGPDGMINIDGTFGSPSIMTSVHDPNFWDFIEVGIAPVVRVLINHGIETFGCCQGHYLSANKWSPANVRYFICHNSQSLRSAIAEYSNGNVKISEAPPILGRETERITFCLNPKFRKELDDSIETFTVYLDNHLVQSSINSRP